MLQYVEDLGFRYPTPKSKRKYMYVKGLCTCGKTVEVRKDHLNRTLSCGCSKFKSRKEVTVNSVFGRWLVLKDLGMNRELPHPERFVLVYCLCGSGLYERSWYSIKVGRSTSCGCVHSEIMRENMSEVGKSNTAHGQAGTKLYGIWGTMKGRCGTPTATGYEYYGGRGIKVCEEWVNSFENFLAWASQTGYEEGLTIDRIDHNGDYEPSNCQWLTKSENSKKMQRDRRRR